MAKKKDKKAEAIPTPEQIDEGVEIEEVEEVEEEENTEEEVAEEEEEAAGDLVPMFWVHPRHEVAGIPPMFFGHPATLVDGTDCYQVLVSESNIADEAGRAGNRLLTALEFKTFQKKLNDLNAKD